MGASHRDAEQRELEPREVAERPLMLALTTPPECPEVYRAILRVASDIGQTGISKDRANQQQGFKFRGIDDMLNALSPLLVKHGLVIIPTVEERTVAERESRNGGVLIYTTVRVRFTVVSALDGSRHEGVTMGEAMDSADKSTNKAMSAAYKYFVILTFCIPTEGDNDADATTHDVKPPPLLDRLRVKLQLKGIAPAKVCQHFSVEALEDLSEAQLAEAMKRAEAK